jgi:hypothetical protein
VIRRNGTGGDIGAVQGRCLSLEDSLGGGNRAIHERAFVKQNGHGLFSVNDALDSRDIGACAGSARTRFIKLSNSFSFFSSVHQAIQRC